MEREQKRSEETWHPTLKIYTPIQTKNHVTITVYSTSKVLTTPAASDTTFSWVSMAPFGSPEAENAELKLIHLELTTIFTSGGTTLTSQI